MAGGTTSPRCPSAAKRIAGARPATRALARASASAQALPSRIVVIGASTGGVGALCALVEDLPSNLACAILIVQHVGAKSILPEVLRRCRHERDDSVTVPIDGEPIRPGRIYVAIPDRHLTVEDGRIHLPKGPRENLHRPSIDVLFRSAARAYGSRVVGVILTGALDDGASGMFAVKAKGGIAIVHDPKEAIVPDMPLSAMKAVPVDHCLPIAGIAQLIVKLSSEPVAKAPGSRAKRPRPEVKERPRFDASHPAFVCPECDGPLIEYREGNVERFECKVGHAFSLEGLGEAHADTLERALWIALRVLEDRAAIQRLRAKKFAEQEESRRARASSEIAAQAERDAKLLREVMERL
ncbi:MAG: chemotaxis protein CheB [Burkholderiales bacterium]|nr:chemotaxis protein CheB [Burkholderiales bacterium]